jgi:hypothetical protein
MKRKLKDIKEDFYAFSSMSSTISRQLGLAGIAIIWFFKIATPDHIQLGNELVLILQLLGISLILDFCHAFVPTFIYGVSDIYHRSKGKNDEDEINFSGKWMIPDWIFFIAKIFFLIYAYIKLWNYLSDKLI